MANQMFVKGAERFGKAQVNWETATVKAALVKSTYTPNLSTHEFYSDLSAHVLGTPQALANKTFAGGKFDADDVNWSGISAGESLLGVALYIDTGVAGTSPLLWWFSSITGFPFTTTGADVTVRWNNGAQRIFSLV